MAKSRILTLNLSERATEEEPATYAVIEYEGGTGRKDRLFRTEDAGTETLAERRLAHLNAVAELMMAASDGISEGVVNALGDLLWCIAGDIDDEPFLHMIPEDELKGWPPPATQ